MRRWGCRQGQGSSPGSGSGAPEVRRASRSRLLSHDWARVLEKDAIMVETEGFLCGGKMDWAGSPAPLGHWYATCANLGLVGEGAGESVGAWPPSLQMGGPCTCGGGAGGAPRGKWGCIEAAQSLLLRTFSSSV